MELATTIGKLLRLRPFSAPVIVLMLSVSGWTQQAPPASQKVQASTGHTGAIEYRNKEYGFRFTLPGSWKGYRVLWLEWHGGVRARDGSEEHSLHGPKLVIRHPKWTQENPREDMPIMIFTVSQWNEGPDVSASPFDLTELGRNRKYVFAVPPRWEYDFSEGYEEAVKLLTPASLHTFAPAK